VRTKFYDHLLLSAFGGCLIGAVEGHAMASTSSGILGEFVVLWTPWGLVCGLVTWPFVRSRARWATAAVLSAGVIAAAGAALSGGGRWSPLLVPALAQFLAAAYGMRRWPAEYAAGMCRGCGYDLRGLPVARCPECGREFESGRGGQETGVRAGHDENHLPARRA
jgi:hypothetical protein